MKRCYRFMYRYMLSRPLNTYRFNKVAGTLEYISGSEWVKSINSDEILKLIGGPNAIV